MEEKIAALRAELEADLAAVHNKDELSAFWQKYLSKNGSVTGLTKSLRDVPKEERPAAGKTINEFKVWVEGQYQAASAEIEKAELAARNKAEAVDITLPGTHHATGALHPITQIKNEIIDVFAGMGFEIYEGPEIEDDDHNFTRLNVPKDHPARDMQDTFYLSEEFLLRTQTSGGQIRTMDSQMAIDMMNCLGGSATVMGYSDIYTGMQQGVIDGAENNVTALRDHGDVTKYYCFDEHTRIPDMVIISSNIWNQFSDDQKSAVTECAKAATEEYKTAWKNFEDEVLDKAVNQNGVELVKDVDIAAFQSAVQPIYENLKTANPTTYAVVEEIRAMV